MIQTEEQRRWWFATHPEYSHGRNQTKAGEGGKTHQNKIDPREVGKYVDRALNYEKGPDADLLRSLKRHFGTENQTAESIDYNRGWHDGYRGAYWKSPPDISPSDNSPYARGVRDGVLKAIEESSELARKLDELFSFLGANTHSRALRKNLENAGEPRPSAGYDGHHIVPWNHRRAKAAGDILEKWNIDIDAAVNGVWLRREFHWTLNNSKRYMDSITSALRQAKSKKEVLGALKSIKDSLSKEKALFEEMK